MRNSVQVMLTNYVKMITDPVLRNIVKNEPIDESAINNNVIDLADPAMKAIQIKQEDNSEDDESPENLNRIDLIPRDKQTPAFRILNNVLKPLDLSNVRIPVQKPIPVPVPVPVPVPEKSAIQKEKERYQRYYDSNSRKILDQQAEYKAKNKNRIRIVKNLRMYSSPDSTRIPSKALQTQDELYQDPDTKMWRSKVLEK